MPITHWHQKRDIMKAEFSEDTYKGIFYHALNNKNDADRYKALEDAAKKWDEVTPSSVYYPEIDNLCEKLFKQRGSEVIQFFIDSLIGDFKARLEQSRMQKNGSAAVKRDWFHQGDHILIALDEERGETVIKSVRSRRLDQKLYYMNVDSADVWHELINSSTYRIYDWCRESLRAIVRSSEWKQALASGEFATFVALGGGGSATKDFEVLNALVDLNYRAGQPNKTRYMLVDISAHMLVSSVTRIKGFFKRETRASRLLEIEAFAADMMRLGELKHRLRSHNARNVWFLTGGTIGNFNESKLLGSLEKVAAVGDLLVTGIDTYDPQDMDTHVQAIKANYNPKAMQDFLSTPMSALLHSIDTDLPVRQLREKIAVDVVDGRKQGYSDIDGALTAEVRLDLGADDSYTLLTSTRYDLEAYTAWFAARGWKRLGDSRPTDASATFRQVLFQKVNAR